VDYRRTEKVSCAKTTTEKINDPKSTKITTVELR